MLILSEKMLGNQCDYEAFRGFCMLVEVIQSNESIYSIIQH